MGPTKFQLEREMIPPKKKEANMRSMNLKGIQSVCIGCLVTLFLTLPLGEALAVSMKEHTAKLVEGAKKEGKMVWYTTIDINDAQALLKGFEKKYPFIKTGVWRSGGARHLSRIMAEARANRHLWDVVMSGGTKSELIRKRGLTARF
jgi:iron(III) transport system substrate-binding protein